MVALNRQYGHLYEQSHYACQRCGARETEAMLKRAHNFARPYCDTCSLALRHEGHGPGSGLIVGHSMTEMKIDAAGKMAQKTTTFPDIPIAKCPSRCPVCFANEPQTGK